MAAGERKPVEAGDMVICLNGAIGVLLELRPQTDKGLVAFGCAGPHRWHKLSGMRAATRQEIKDAGLHGVGCNQG